MTFRFQKLVVPFNPQAELKTGNVSERYRFTGPDCLEDFTPHDRVQDEGPRIQRMLDAAYEAGRAAERHFPVVRMGTSE